MSQSDRICSIYLDVPNPAKVGEYIVCMSRKTKRPTGHAYRVVSVRKVNSNVHKNRHTYECLRCQVADIPDAAIRHTLWWYSRNKKK